MPPVVEALAALLAAGAAETSAAPWLVDVTESAGVAFRHHAAHSARWLYPETFGAGLAIVDLERDGDLDLLLLDTGSPPGASTVVPARHALLRNDTARPGAPIRFTALTPPDLPGLAAMGACAGDVDADGDDDVYVTGLPAGLLLLNTEGTLAPAPDNGGVRDPGWSTSCTFLDADRDGRLDLFSGHYVRWSAGAEVACGGERPGFRSYCPPDRYPGEPPRLFRGDGTGRFTDVSAATGVAATRGKNLGVVAADIDGDAFTDVYLANDQVANELLLGGPAGFREVALRAGVAFSEEGKAQAGMGVDAGDLDGDGDIDLTVANLDLETNNLYVNVGVVGGIPRFRDAVHAAGLGQATLMSLGFGAVLADLDHDGDLDSFVVNGHILPNVAVIRPDQSHAMADQLFENVTETPSADAAPRLRLVDAGARWHPAATHRGVGRGLACGDLDGDGDLDLVTTSNDGAARVLRNDRGGRWLGLVLHATRSAPGAPGASAEVQLPGLRLVALRRTGGSYLSASDTRLVLGLSRAPADRRAHVVTVTWTTGQAEPFGPLDEGRYHVLREGSGRAAAPR
jgi:hypothetical protein